MGLKLEQRPEPIEDFQGRKKLVASATITKNTGSTQVLKVAVPKNSLVYIRTLIKASIGRRGAAVACTVANATETFTTTATLALVAGEPVLLGGTTLPTGASAIVYFVGGISGNNFFLYTNSANAITGGATGKLAVTGDGVAVTVTPVCVQGFYVIEGVVRNQNGLVTVLGSVTKDAYEDVAGWDATVQADNTNKNLQVMMTPDVDNDTYVEVMADVIVTSGK